MAGPTYCKAEPLCSSQLRHLASNVDFTQMMMMCTLSHQTFSAFQQSMQCWLLITLNLQSFDTCMCRYARLYHLIMKIEYSIYASWVIGVCICVYMLIYPIRPLQYILTGTLALWLY